MFKPSLGRLGLFLVSLLGLMSLFSASALASGPPIVTVSAATNKSLNTANLNGTVDKNGASSASVKFEYGKTKLYGKSVSVSPVSTAGAVPVSLFASGLEPLSTYHFRVSATNSFGTTVSEDMTFEMLLSWKVNGKSASEYSEPTLQSKFGNEPVTIERTIGANVYKLSCTAYVGGNLAVLNKEYNLPFRNCKAYANGVEQKACVAPFEKVVHLNAFAATTKPEFIEFCLLYTSPSPRD